MLDSLIHLKEYTALLLHSTFQVNVRDFVGGCKQVILRIERLSGSFVISEKALDHVVSVIPDLKKASNPTSALLLVAIANKYGYFSGPASSKEIDSSSIAHEITAARNLF